MYQFNNSITFVEEPIGSETSLNRMVEALGISRSKEWLRKMEN